MEPSQTFNYGWDIIFGVSAGEVLQAGIGRFVSRDPTGYKDGMNLYVYVRNNPINLIDSLGLYAGNKNEEEDCLMECRDIHINAIANCGLKCRHLGCPAVSACLLSSKQTWFRGMHLCMFWR